MGWTRGLIKLRFEAVDEEKREKREHPSAHPSDPYEATHGVDFIERDVSRVFDVFLLLSVPWWLYEEIDLIWSQLCLLEVHFTTKKCETEAIEKQNLTFQSLDDQRTSRGDDGDSSLTVLDRQLNSDPQTFPVTGSFGDIFSDLLR